MCLVAYRYCVLFSLSYFSENNLLKGNEMLMLLQLDTLTTLYKKKEKKDRFYTPCSYSMYKYIQMSTKL